jgi:hypothetical protein
VRREVPPSAATPGRRARRGLRLFFGPGWILVLCLVVFGAVGASFLLGALPRGPRGLLRALWLGAGVWFAAGVAGPLVTRALLARRPRGPRP